MPCSLSRRNTWHTWLVGKGAGVAANVDLMMGSLLSGKITSINKEYSICPVFCSKANHLKSQELVPSNIFFRSIMGKIRKFNKTLMCTLCGTPK